MQGMLSSECCGCNACARLVVHLGMRFLQVGEIMDDRYEVFDTLGKGVFSTVLRARDTAHKNALGKHPEVAVKVPTLSLT